MLRNVVFHDRRFSVEGIDITDRTAFDKAFQLVSQIYNSRFLVDYAAFDKKRKLRQKEGGKKRRKVTVYVRWPCKRRSLRVSSTYINGLRPCRERK